MRGSIIVGVDGSPEATDAARAAASLARGADRRLVLAHVAADPPVFPLREHRGSPAATRHPARQRATRSRRDGDRRTGGAEPDSPERAHPRQSRGPPRRAVAGGVLRPARDRVPDARSPATGPCRDRVRSRGEFDRAPGAHRRPGRGPSRRQGRRRDPHGCLPRRGVCSHPRTPGLPSVGKAGVRPPSRAATSCGGVRGSSALLRPPAARPCRRACRLRHLAPDVLHRLDAADSRDDVEVVRAAAASGEPLEAVALPGVVPRPPAVLERFRQVRHHHQHPDAEHERAERRDQVYRSQPDARRSRRCAAAFPRGRPSAGSGR